MIRGINRTTYLEYAKALTENEKKFIQEFEEWLPKVIIDCHAHCNLPEHVHAIDDRAYGHIISTFPSFRLDESEEWHTLFHPGKKIRSLRFPKTFRGIDHRAANLYLLEQSNMHDRVALYGLPDDPAYTIRMLRHPRVSALKMYYSYYEPPATEIYQYFPKIILEAAQAKNIPIILHPPQKITISLGQIINLAENFPRLRICLAHLSLTKNIVPGLEEAFTALANYPLINFDTALVPSEEVVAIALRIVGSDRIMYGSDEPLNLIRSVPYMHPQRGERLVTNYPYHWVDKAEQQKYKYMAIGATHAHWLTLRAIKMAISAFTSSEQEVVRQKLFYNNAKSFYNFE